MPKPKQNDDGTLGDMPGDPAAHPTKHARIIDTFFDYGRKSAFEQGFCKYGHERMAPLHRTTSRSRGIGKVNQERTCEAF
jgi:hypothetical protein